MLASGLSGQFQVIQAGIRYPVALPAMHRRDWRFEERGDLSCPAEIGHRFIGEPLHERHNAIIAASTQAESCDNGICYVREDGFEEGMQTADLLRLLRLHIEEGKDTQTGIAALLGIHPTAVSKLLAGKRRLQPREADILRGFFRLSDGERERGATRQLPIVGLVSAGAWREGFEEIMGHMPSPDPSLSEDSFAVIVEGDSMDKVANEGETVIVDPRDLDLTDGRFYVIRNSGGETTFKQYREGPARLEPCSHNPAHQTILLGHEQVTVIGRVRKKVLDL